MTQSTPKAKKPKNTEMGNRIRRLRLKLNLSQNDLAKYLGVSRVAIIKYENGNSRPVRRLDRIATILHTTSDYLLTGHTDNSSASLPDILGNVLLPSEVKLLCLYRGLDEKSRSVVDATISALSFNKNPRTEEPGQ